MNLLKPLSLGTSALLLSSVVNLAQAEAMVTMNVVQVIGTIDPAKVNDYTEYAAAVNLYDGLTTLTGSGAIVPLLAKGWDVSNDALSYTFHLQDNATFQDGTPVEAKDMVYSVQRLLSLNEGPAGRFAGILEAKNVQAVDSKTVRFRLNKTFSPFLSITPSIFIVNSDAANAHASDDDKWATEYLASNPLGAGPFTLGNWNRGADMSLNRHADYYRGWGNQPIDKVRFVVTTEEATVKAMAASGELSMSSNAQASETYKALAATSGYNINTFDTGMNFYLKLNHKTSPTDDVHIRKAIALATDYDTVRSQIMPGAPLSGPVPNLFSGAQPEGLKQPVFDLAQAKAEVAKSKYAGATPIDVEIMYVAGLGFEEEMGLLMKSNLDQIGFNTILKPEPWNRMTELAASPETTPAVNQVFFSAQYPSADSYFYGQYHSNSSGSWASMEWLQNDKIDALIEKARSTGDVDRQNEIYQEITSYLVENQVDIFLLTRQSRIAMSDCLQGFEWVPMMSFEYDFHKMQWTCQ